MDNYEYTKILEEPCCFNYENYLSDNVWVNQSSLSQISKKEVLKEPSEKEEENKRNKLELNVMKYYK
jgi:hypothetical protein